MKWIPIMCVISRIQIQLMVKVNLNLYNTSIQVNGVWKLCIANNNDRNQAANWIECMANGLQQRRWRKKIAHIFWFFGESVLLFFFLVSLLNLLCVWWKLPSFLVEERTEKPTDANDRERNMPLNHMLCTFLSINTNEFDQITKCSYVLRGR